MREYLNPSVRSFDSTTIENLNTNAATTKLQEIEHAKKLPAILQRRHKKKQEQMQKSEEIELTNQASIQRKILTERKVPPRAETVPEADQGLPDKFMSELIEDGSLKEDDQTLPAERRLRRRRERMKTRFDEPPEQVLEKKHSKELLRKAADAFKAKEEAIRPPPPQDQLDFFCKDWDAEEPEVVPDIEEPAVPEPSTSEDTRIQVDDEQPLVAPIAFDGGAPFIAVRAEYEPESKRLEMENKLYFVPSSDVVPPTDKVDDEGKGLAIQLESTMGGGTLVQIQDGILSKIGAGKQVRDLVSEGFFVGEQTMMADSDRNRMEQRLAKYKDNGLRWFGVDGRIKALPESVRQICQRPRIQTEEETHPMLECHYRKAKLDTAITGSLTETTHKYQLCIDVNSIDFKHHPLFNKENVLAQQLGELYAEYLKRMRLKITQGLVEKIRTLQEAMVYLNTYIEHAKVLEGKDKGKDDEYVVLQKQLESYQLELKQVREKRSESEARDKHVFERIKDLWLEMKRFREEHFTSTNLKLEFTKRKLITEQEAKVLQDSEVEMEYQERLKAYKIELQTWKLLRKERRLDEKLQKKKMKKATTQPAAEGDPAPAEEEANAAETETSQEVPEPPELPPLPARPLPPTREALVEEFVKNRWKYGVPPFDIKMTQDASLTQVDKKGFPLEFARQEAVTRCRYFVKVFFNDKLVASTVTSNLTSGFSVYFREIFDVQIYQWPQSIKLELYDSGLMSNLVTEVFLPIPSSSQTTQTTEPQCFEFASDRFVKPASGGVGSGVELNQALGTEPVEGKAVLLHTNGVIMASASWAVQDGMVLCPLEEDPASKKHDPISVIGMAGLKDPKKFSNWLKNANLDPNNPDNAELFYILSLSENPPEYFRLDQTMEEFSFCTSEQLEENKRAQMLVLRDKGIAEFRDCRMVPIIEREIDTSLFELYEQRIKDELVFEDETDVLEVHRRKVESYLMKAREQILERYSKITRQKRFEDVINEDRPPDLKMFVLDFKKYLEPRRPLQPKLQTKKKLDPAIYNRDVNILVTVHSAYDVPIREDVDAAYLGTQRSQTQTFQGQHSTTSTPALVKPYFEVSFRNARERSFTADGSNPCWNQTLTIPFSAQDYNTGSLQTIRDLIHLNLFDEIIFETAIETASRAPTFERRITKRWLGSFSLPFSTLYFNSKVNGTFCLKTPPLLTSYRPAPDVANPFSGAQTAPVLWKPIKIDLDITLDPQLIVPDPFVERFFSSEEETLLAEIDKWRMELQARFPDRDYTGTVMDITGKSIFVSRYLRPIKPPDICVSADDCARFVSMIPFVSDNVMFSGVCDIWSTCQQLIDWLQGDEEEHACLLACYLLHMGVPTWLCLGNAVPEGSSAYVLSKQEEQFWLWNCSTGRRYNVKDETCPVQSIGTIVSKDNLYGNVHPKPGGDRDLRPKDMLFDFNDTARWKPLLSKDDEREFTSIQPEAITYTETSPELVERLKEKIRHDLWEVRFRQVWRPRTVTRLHRECSQYFNGVLVELEQNRGKGVSAERIQDIRNRFGQTYELCGFTINRPYNGSVKPICDEVHSTGVWETDIEEFVFALHLTAYPNNVVSVWLHIASMHAKVKAR